MKVTIGIPTYNRKALLEIMSTSLFHSDLGLQPNIRIYDDCSTAFDAAYLKTLFPMAASIKVNATNLRSDRNIYQMYRDFLATDDAYFFNADSDIIFNSGWLSKGLELLEQTEGILSLFNANSHKPHRVVNEALCLKETIGSAGTLFTRARVQELIAHFDSIEAVGGFDWQWCAYFKGQGVPIYCVNHSLVQHIGFEGQNSHLYFDVGENYAIGSLEEGQIIHDIFVQSISAIRLKEQERVVKEAQLHALRANDFSYHLKRCFIIVIKKLVPKSFYKGLKQQFKDSE